MPLVALPALVNANFQIQYTDNEADVNGLFYGLDENILDIPMGGAKAAGEPVLYDATGLDHPNEQVFLFQGFLDQDTGILSPGLLLWGFQMSTDGGWAAVPTADVSALPSALAGANVAVQWTDANAFAYTGPTTGTRAQLQQAITMTENWTAGASCPTGLTVIEDVDGGTGDGGPGDDAGPGDAGGGADAAVDAPSDQIGTDAVVADGGRDQAGDASASDSGGADGGSPDATGAGGSGGSDGGDGAAGADAAVADGGGGAGTADARDATAEAAPEAPLDGSTLRPMTGPSSGCGCAMTEQLDAPTSLVGVGLVAALMVLFLRGRQRRAPVRSARSRPPACRSGGRAA